MRVDQVDVGCRASTNRPGSQYSQCFLGFAEIKWRFITLMIHLCCFGLWGFIALVRKQSSLSKYLQWFDKNWWGIFWCLAIFSGQFQSNDKSKQNGYLSNIPRVRDEIKPRNLRSDTKYRFSTAANQSAGPDHVIMAAANERALPRFTIDQNS